MNRIGEVVAKLTYRQQLKDPRWRDYSRERRNDIGNCCEVCRRGDLPIQVHHWFYDGRMAWEYEHHEVIALCEPCHKLYHTLLKQFREFVFSKLTPQAFRVLNGALAVGCDKNDPLHFAYAVAEMAASPDSVKRFAASWKGTGDPKLTSGQQ